MDDPKKPTVDQPVPGADPVSVPSTGDATPADTGGVTAPEPLKQEEPAPAKVPTPPVTEVPPVAEVPPSAQPAEKSDKPDTSGSL